MAIPASGPVSFTTIQTEFGGSNPISLSEYYAGGAYVAAGTTGTYGAVPSSGQIGVANFYGTSAVTVPTAPTIGTATSASATSVTVTYTASSSNGGSTITSYTAISTPGSITGSLATSGSGTITVSGLSTGTSYTFKVYATNAIGNSPQSAASNSVVPTAPVTGQTAYTTPGTYSWVAPSGVTSVSVVCVGAGGTYGYPAGYGASGGGGGGALAYTNNISVTPGNSYTVVVGAGVPFNYDGVTQAGPSTFNGTSVGAGGGGSGQITGPNYYGIGGVVLYGTGGSGGTGGIGNLSGNYPGGGGAGGYSGAGGNGGSDTAGANGSGGGGGGGAARSGGSGGGVGIMGQGASGTGGTYNGGVPGANGTGGSSNPTSPSNIPTYAQYGGAFGVNQQSGSYTSSGSGAVRIIYPGTTRAFPSTNTGDM